MLDKPKNLTNFARANRKEPSKAEKMLWQALRGPRGDGLRFRRQHIVGPYIADFCCIRARIIIEVDGWSHDDTVAEDEERQRYLEEQGFEVLRFGNMEVIKNCGALAQAISQVCVERARILFGDDYGKRRDTSPPALPLPPPGAGGE